MSVATPAVVLDTPATSAVAFTYDGKSCMTAGALERWTMLTIGDGLVSQIPAFIVALGAVLIVTRQIGDSDLGEDVIGQVLANPQAQLVAAVFLAILATMGMPLVPLIILGGCCLGLAYVVRKPAEQATENQPATPTKKETRAS